MLHRLMLFAVVALAVVGRAAAEDKPPNIVFIFADDWGWGDLSCHGHEDYRTPNIDRLAADGIDFQKFHACNPVCSPSRTAAMTGHFPSRYCVYQHFAEHALNRSRGMPDWLDPRAPMLPRMLQQAGYRTGHFGKWHLTTEMVGDAPLPQAYGIDESAVFNGPGNKATSDSLADEAVKFIRQNKDRPFYVNVWLHESHTPHYPSQAALDAQHGLDEQHHVYAAVIADGDRKVGQVLNTLRELKLDDKTIVIFSSDNGPEWTGPEANKQLNKGLGTYYSVGSTAGRRGRKRSLFEGGVNVPFIVRWPGHAPAGTTDDSTVISAVDLLPTLCAAAGVSPPSDYRPDGESMLAAFEGHPVERTTPLFWEWRGPGPEPDYWPRLTVREGEWKLVADSNGDRVELYDLATDPDENDNRAEKDSERVKRLTKMVVEWRDSLPKVPPEECISNKPRPQDRKTPQ